MLNPNAPTEYVIHNHKLFTYVIDGVIITDTRDPRVINFIANRNYDVEYPTPKKKKRKEMWQRILEVSTYGKPVLSRGLSSLLK